MGRCIDQYKETKVSKGVIDKELAHLLLGKIICSDKGLMLETSVSFVISSQWKFDPYLLMFATKF